MISTPVDVEFEMLTIGCAIHLLESLLQNRFQGISLETDNAELANNPNLTERRRIALQHRVSCKEILCANIKLCNILIHILANLQLHLERGKTEFSKVECKRIYMQRIERYEKTDQEVMLNRLRFRRYIRELILN